MLSEGAAPADRAIVNRRYGTGGLTYRICVGNEFCRKSRCAYNLWKTGGEYKIENLKFSIPSLCLRGIHKLDMRKRPRRNGVKNDI